MRLYALCLALLSVFAFHGRPAMALDKQPDAPYLLQGRLETPTDQPGRDSGIVFGTPYHLEDSRFVLTATLGKVQDAAYEISGVLALKEPHGIVRWSTRRLFLVLYDSGTEVAKIYLPNSENARHELVFKKAFYTGVVFDRFEISIIGDVRLD